MCQEPLSPIIVDLDRDGLALTDVANGVSFDFGGNGSPVRMSWTAAGARDGFLVLDRNNDGVINDGKELFGDITEQPAPKGNSEKKSAPNGFLALAVFDDPINGGNGDKQVTADDAIYESLRLWMDLNHDGQSQGEELKTLDELGIRSVSLHYAVSKSTDAYGNQLRFSSHVMMDKDLTIPGPVPRRATDVFLSRAVSRP